MNVKCGNSDEWETPPDLFAEWNNRFDFTIDAAANDANHKCERYFTKERSGLDVSWAGERVWINPPYSQIGLWTSKAAEERGQNNSIVMLLPVRTDTQWFHSDVWNVGRIVFMRKRVRFLMDGVPAGSPRFASMVVIF